MIIYIIISMLTICRCQLCDRQQCITNQMDFNGEFVLEDLLEATYSFWYKYYIFKSEGQLVFNIFSNQSAVKPEFLLTIEINDQIATHEFQYENQTLWDQQLKVDQGQDMDSWHFFIMYFDNNQLMIKIWFADSIYNGVTRIQSIERLTIQPLQYYQDILTILCGQHSFMKSQINFNELPLSSCNDGLDKNIIIEFRPDIVRYLIQSFSLGSAKLYIWLKDEHQYAHFQINFFTGENTSINNLFAISKNRATIELIVQNWDTSCDLIYNNTVAQFEEFQQWYYLEFDHSQSLIIRTIAQQFLINFEYYEIFTDAQLELFTDNVIFSQFIISSLKIYFCPPNCQQCTGMTCTMCRGNRIGQNCTCPPYQLDYGLISCEYPYLKLPVQVFNSIQKCQMGYLKCSPQEILCDFNYIKYEDSCIKCPMLGTEVCQQCLTAHQISQNQLQCQYINKFNLLRFQKYQIEDYMEFQQGGSFYMDNKFFSQVDLLSVIIFYQVNDKQFQPILRKKDPIKDIIICPFNYQQVSELDHQIFCLKLPKQCLYLSLRNQVQQCVFCREGYSLIQDNCIKCPQYCSSCIQFRCSSCFIGYYLSIDGSCRICNIPNCKLCYEYQNDLLSLNDDFRYEPFQTLCALCDENFEFNYNNNNCQFKQSDFCHISIVNNTRICLIDKKQNTNSLSISCEIPNCIECYKSTCLICQAGYFLEKQQCRSCHSLLVNSKQIFTNQILCNRGDLTDYQNKKQSIQHILYYHQKSFVDLTQFPVKIVGCIDDQINYDISNCQPINNEYADPKIRYCDKYILQQNGKPYCIKIDPQLTDFTINRETGFVTYCQGYIKCSKKAIYELQIYKYKGYLFEGNYYENVQHFIDAVNYSYMLQEQIEEISIQFQMQESSLHINNQYAKNSINLNINNELDQVDIEIFSMNEVLIDFVHGSNRIIIQCFNLTINEYQSSDYSAKQSQVVKTFINSSLLLIHNMKIIDNIHRQLLFNYFGQTIIDLDNVLINHNCSNSIYFIIDDIEQVTIRIQNLHINNSNLTNCSLFNINAYPNIQIVNLTIDNSIFNSSIMINSHQLQVDNILILNSIIYNSIMFSVNQALINITLSGCDFYNVSVIVSNDESQLNKLLVMRSFMLDTCLLCADGRSLVINNIKIHKLVSLTLARFDALLKINSRIVTIHDFFISLQQGNTTVLMINSYSIMLNKIYLLDNIEPYVVGVLNDNCQISINVKEYHSFMIILDYTLLWFQNSQFVNIYTKTQLITITSSDHSIADISNITFSNISQFSPILVELHSGSCSFNDVYFFNIWVHEIKRNQRAIYQIVQIISEQLITQNLYFIRIKSINIKRFMWMNFICKILDMRTIIFQQSTKSISHLIKYNEQSQAQAEYINNASGDFSLLQINAISIKIDDLQIRNFTNTANYLIQIVQTLPIDFLKITNIYSYSLAFCKGFLQVSQTVNNAVISHNEFYKIWSFDYLFDFRIKQSITILDTFISTIRSGAILNCDLVDEFTQSKFENLKIYAGAFEESKFLTIYQNQKFIFNIMNGQIMMKNISLKRVIGDVLNIQNAVNITLISIRIENGYYVNNLIQIYSLETLQLRIFYLEIKKYNTQKNLTEIKFAQREVYEWMPKCWSGPFSYFQFEYKTYYSEPIMLLNIIMDINKDQLALLKNIRIYNNSNSQILLKFENIQQIKFINLSILNNSCSDVCVMIQNNQPEQIINSAEYISSQILKNRGILLDIGEQDTSFIKSILLHNGVILKNTSRTQQFQSHNSILINSGFQINELKQINNPEANLTHQFNQPYLVLSFDNGLTQYMTVNNNVVFNNKYLKLFTYCNFPTGQSLGDYQRINFRNLNYTQFIKQMKFILRGKNSEIDQQCDLYYQNTSVRFYLASQNWTQFKIIHNPKNKSLISLKLVCETVNLEFQIQILNCQLGEILVDNGCLRCPQNQYSLKPNSVKCSYINDFIDETQSGLIKVKEGYWRPYFTNDQISECLRYENCQGGWNIGNYMCKKGHIGALCQECDLYSIRGDGKYSKKQPNECVLCYRSYSAYIQLGFIIILHFTILYSARISWNANNVRIQNLRLFKSKLFMRLYQFELDQYQNLAEISNNWIQIFVIIEESCDVIPNIIRNILNVHQNPSLNIQSLFQCLISDYLTFNEVTYSTSIISVVLYIILIQISLLIYCVQIIISKYKYQLKLVLLIVNQVIFDHYINVAEKQKLFKHSLIKQSTWVSISGIKWTNAQKSLEYMTQTHLFNLCIMILPQAIIVFLVIPIFYYYIINREPKLLFNKSFFNKWGYCYSNYKQGYHNWFLVIISIKILVVIIMNIFDQASLQILLFTLICFSKSHQALKPYLIKKFNKYNIQLLNQLSLIVAQFHLLNYCQTNAKQLVLYIQIIIVFSLIKSCSMIIKNSQPIITQQILEFLNQYKNLKYTQCFCIGKYLKKVIKNHSDRSTHIQMTLQKIKSKAKSQICFKRSSKYTESNTLNSDFQTNNNIHSFPFKINDKQVEKTQYQQELRIKLALFK